MHQRQGSAAQKQPVAPWSKKHVSTKVCTHLAGTRRKGAPSGRVRPSLAALMRCRVCSGFGRPACAADILARVSALAVLPSLAATMRARVSSDTAPPNCASLRVLSAADILARVSSLCRPLDRRGLRSAWPDTSAVSAAPAPGSSDWRPSPACSVCGPAATLAAAGRTLRSLPPGKRGRWSSRQWHMFGTGSAGCVWGKVSAAHLHAYPLRPTAHEGVGGRQALPNMHPRRSRCGAAARSDKRVGLCCVQMFELRRLGVAA